MCTQLNILRNFWFLSIECLRFRFSFLFVFFCLFVCLLEFDTVDFVWIVFGFVSFYYKLYLTIWWCVCVCTVAMSEVNTPVLNMITIKDYCKVNTQQQKNNKKLCIWRKHKNKKKQYTMTRTNANAKMTRTNVKRMSHSIESYWNCYE